MGVAYLGGLALWAVLSELVMGSTPKWVGVLFGMAGALAFLGLGLRAEEKLPPQKRPSLRVAARLSSPVSVLSVLAEVARWPVTARRVFRDRIRLSEEERRELEQLRRHLAARESWEPLRQFQQKREGIEILRRLGLVRFRTMRGEQFFRVTLKGAEKDWQES